MTTLALPYLARTIATPQPLGRRLLLGATALLIALLATAVVRQLALGRQLLPVHPSIWLTLHLVTVIPAVPLGGWLFLARQRSGLHRRLGPVWAGLMLVAALSSFGLRHSGHFSWIHGLALVTLAGVVRGVALAIRRRAAAHGQAMTRVYLGMVIAGFFTFLPGRLLGQWLFG